MFSQLLSGWFIVQIFIVLFSLVIHEFAHAFAADKLGDKTARLQGRLTLNPAAHLELMGLIFILFAPIGWARPVPFNPRNFKNPRLGIILTAAAGPLSNLILACLALAIAKVLNVSDVELSSNSVGLHFILLLVFVNISLFIFNVLPIPPLDGSQILRNLLPYRYSRVFNKLDIYGPFLLLLIVWLFRGAIFDTFVPFLLSFFLSLFGLPQ